VNHKFNGEHTLSVTNQKFVVEHTLSAANTDSLQTTQFWQ